MAWPKVWVLVVLEEVSALEAVANAELEEVPSAELETGVLELVPSLGLETDVLELVPGAEPETGVQEEVAELAAQPLTTSFAELSPNSLASNFPSESGSSLDAEL